MGKRILALVMLLLMILTYIMPFCVNNNTLLHKETDVVIEENSATIEKNIETIVSQPLPDDFENIIPTKEELEEQMNTEIRNIPNSSKKEWFMNYKNIVSNYPKELHSSTIYDSLTSEELDLLFRVVQAEIGNYSFEQKCNVVSVIFNRINHKRFPNTIFEVLIPSQFCTIRNGNIHEVTVDETTILACEYVYMFGDTTNGALFFDSNGALNYKFVFNDGAHNFYILEGE